MKVSELSERSGVSIASIKYYVREGLLAPGTRTASNQAAYGEQHVRRLRLIRSMTEIGGLSIAHVRAALAAVEDVSASMHDAFGAVMHGLDELPATDDDSEVAAAYEEVQAWLTARDWHVDPDAPARYRLAELIATLHRSSFPVTLEYFDGAADNFDRSAELEVKFARAQPDRTASVEAMLVGTVIIERALGEIRRLGLEAASYRIENDS